MILHTICITFSLFTHHKRGFAYLHIEWCTHRSIPLREKRETEPDLPHLGNSTSLRTETDLTQVLVSVCCWWKHHIFYGILCCDVQIVIGKLVCSRIPYHTTPTKPTNQQHTNTDPSMHLMIIESFSLSFFLSFFLSFLLSVLIELLYALPCLACEPFRPSEHSLFCYSLSSVPLSFFFFFFFFSPLPFLRS